MKKFIEFLRMMIAGETDAVSSRRFIAFSAFLVILGTVLASIFGAEIPEFMFWGLITILLTCLGLTTIKP